MASKGLSVGGQASVEKETPIVEHKIICSGGVAVGGIIKLGDCISHIKEIDSNTFDIVIADPPYNIGKDFGNNQDSMPLEEYVGWSIEWIDHCFRVLKDTGTLYIYGFPEILAHISVNFDLKKQRWLVWHYTNKTVPSSKFWQRSFESILVLWKSDSRIFNRDDVREEYTETFLNNAAGKVRKSTVGRFSKGNKETVYNAHKGGALPRDVIKVSALAGGAGKKERFFYCKTCDDIDNRKQEHIDHEIVEHPTQKPIELTKKLLLASKPKENGKLLVPFAGTGSELLVAKQLNIDAIGFDLNEYYVKMANLLIEKGFPK